MQKKILCICILFIMPIAAMETAPVKLTPYIVYNTKNKLQALEAKLTEKFSSKSKCPKNEIEFSHQSPEITRIHSNDYLNDLDQNPTAMLAAIDHTFGWSWYPNMYSRSYLPPMLDNVHTTFAATECVLALTQKTNVRPAYVISLAESYSFAGHNKGGKGDVYASIPTAAAYVLQEHRDNVRRILVIDENITKNTAEYYFKNGNGSIFFPENNPQLSAIFNNKIVTHNQIATGLWDFLENLDNKIDLAFYNINIDDVEPIDGMNPAEAKERVLNIWSLLRHFIPTVFIFSGDKDKHQSATYSTITHINEIAQSIASSHLFDNQKLEQTKNELIKKQLEAGIEQMDKFMDYLKNRCPLSPQISTNNALSESESYSDLEQEQIRLKKKLGLYCSSSRSEGDIEYQATETSSTDEP